MRLSGEEKGREDPRAFVEGSGVEKTIVLHLQNPHLFLFSSLSSPNLRHTTSSFKPSQPSFSPEWLLSLYELRLLLSMHLIWQLILAPYDIACMAD